MSTQGMHYVLFRKSFSYENAPNISHVTKPDGSATMCGRKGWATIEATIEAPFDPNYGVDCLRCAKAIEKAARAAAKASKSEGK